MDACMAGVFETLGLGWQKILLYLINFLILFAGLFFLLYKPVKKFMDKRTKDIAAEVSSAEVIKKEAEAVRQKSLEEVNDAREEARKRVSELEEERKILLEENAAALSEARAEADKIVSEAEKTAREERRKAVIGAKNDVADIAIMVASEILDREITDKDNEKLIDKCMKEWKEND